MFAKQWKPNYITGLYTGNAFNYKKPTFKIKTYFISLFLSEEKCSVFQKLIKCRVQE